MLKAQKPATIVSPFFSRGQKSDVKIVDKGQIDRRTHQTASCVSYPFIRYIPEAGSASNQSCQPCNMSQMTDCTLRLTGKSFNLFKKKENFSNIPRALSGKKSIWFPIIFFSPEPVFYVYKNERSGLFGYFFRFPTNMFVQETVRYRLQFLLTFFSYDTFAF